MTNKLTQKIKDIGNRTIDFVYGTTKKAIPILLGSYIYFSLLSHNGCMDSDREERAARKHHINNPIRTVESVEETWKDNNPYCFISGAGYNPRVIRNITFEDGSTTRLDYRTAAHQPYRRWLRGNEFNPKPNERFEVDPNNRLVRKVN